MKSKLLLLSFLTMLLQIQSCKDDDDPQRRFIPEEQLTINQELPEEINESSGLLLLENDFFWTHNDSGDGPFLYKVNLKNQQLSETVMLENVSAVDWESTTKDSENIYIGDTGNNNGDRTDLAIHFFPTADLQSDAITPSTILYSYETQTDFTASAQHNFDCEAMISIGESLYLFTKNRGNLETDIYKLPKTPGTYALEKQGSIAVEGLITAACISPSNERICLLGYNTTDDGNLYTPFIWLIDDFDGADFLNGDMTRVNIGLNAQTEGIEFLDEDFVYFSAEAESGGTARYYGLDLNPWF